MYCVGVLLCRSNHFETFFDGGHFNLESDNSVVNFMKREL